MDIGQKSKLRFVFRGQGGGYKGTGQGYKQGHGLAGESEQQSNNFHKWHTVLPSYTLLYIFIKIFHSVTLLWLAQEGPKKFIKGT